MPKRVGRFTFYSREEGEQLNLIPSDEEIAAAEAAFAEFTAQGENLPPRQGDPGLGLGRKWFIDDFVGTEFEGWTHDPATDTWYDAHGRPAYDAHGQRIDYTSTPEEDV